MEGTTYPNPLLFIPITLITILLYYIMAKRRSANLPPGPFGLPLLGSLPFLKPDLHIHFTDLAKTYGPIFSLRLGVKLNVIITSPTLAAEVFKTNDTLFANHPLREVMRSADTGETIMSSPYGPQWRMLRKVAVRQLLSASVMDSYKPLRRQEMHRVLGELESSIGKAVNIRDAAFSVSLNVMLGMLWEGALKKSDMGLRKEMMKIIDDIIDQFGPNISEFLPILAPLDLQGLQRKMKSLYNRFDAIMDSMIEQRLSSTKSTNESVKDFLQLLLDLIESKDKEMPIDLKHVKGLLMDMFFAGTDTAPTSVEWIMAEMMRNPHVMAKAKEELDTVVGKGCIFEETHISSLRYLDAVMKETLRLHPVLPLLFPHVPSETCVIGGYTVPQGTSVFINVWAIQRDPSVWEDPLEFKPERFLDNPGRWDFNGKSYEYLPFGGGRRICAGNNLGERTVKYMLGSLVHSFDWQLPHGTAVVEVDGKFGQVFKKKDPLVLVPFLRA